VSGRGAPVRVVGLAVQLFALYLLKYAAILAGRSLMANPGADLPRSADAGRYLAVP